MRTVTRVQWIAALRSGKFKQGQGKLFNPETEGFCCLGVACALTERPMDHDEFGWSAADGILMPQAVADMLHLSGTLQRKLAGMNDSGQGFDKIADTIERFIEENKEAATNN